MLDIEQSAVILIDVQGKLAKLMHESERMIRHANTLLAAANYLEIPILWVEQLPDKLGPTTPELAKHLDHLNPISKSTFSACGCEEFQTQLKKLKRNQLILAGIETHICLFQTARDLISMGYHVEVVDDATATRHPSNKAVGIERLRANGAVITSVEMAVFEWMRDATHPQFKNIQNLLK